MGEILRAALSGFVIAGFLFYGLPSFAAAGPVQPSTLAGDWVYGGADGRAEIKQTGAQITLELTWLPNSAPPPHYRIDATLSGQALNGKWSCVTTVCHGQSGKFHADIVAHGSQIKVSQTDDPGGSNNWNKTVLVLAPENASAMANALQNTGTVELYKILFDVDKATIKAESAPILNQVALVLRGNPALRLEIAGHTDSTGNEAHNLTLSQARAESVVQALVKTYGIVGTRLQPKGYGDTRPVAPNDTEQNRANNRRVELRKL